MNQVRNLLSEFRGYLTATSRLGHRHRAPFGPEGDHRRQLQRGDVHLRYRPVSFGMVGLRAGLPDIISWHHCCPVPLSDGFFFEKIDPYAALMLLALSSATSWISRVRH